MRITQKTIQRPITTLMVFIGVILLGAVSLVNLPINLLPDVNLPVLTIDTRIAGYLPAEVESLITKPVEDMVSTMNNVHSVRSASREGRSTVSIEFNLGTDMDYAAAEVRERINLIQNNFPRDARNPIIKKYNPAESPILVISVHSDQDSARLREIVENKMEPHLNRIDGVANVELKGGRKREIIIEIDHGSLKSLGFSISQITKILEENNLNFQVGSFQREEIRLITRAVGQFENLTQIENIGIARTKQGSIVLLKDIASVKYAYQKEESIARFQGEPRVMLYVQKESGANILDVSRNIQNELRRLSKILVPKLDIEIIYNQADFIAASIRRLRNEALFGGLLAMIIILLFLKNIQGILIIGTAIPISIFATFSLMYVFGVPLNIISLSGFTLGIGMLVDNSIVVLENIFKKRQRHLNHMESSVSGTMEVGQAITISTIAHIAVFLPVIFLQKKIRILYGGLFFTVSFSLIASLIIAITLIPTLSSKLNLSPFKKSKKRKSYTQRYRRILISCLRHRGKVILAVLALFCMSLLTLRSIGFEPMARIDRGEFTIVVRTPPGTRLAVVDDVAQKLEKIILKTPEVRDVSTEVTTETAQFRVRLIEKEKRLKTTRQIAEDLRPAVSSIPNTQVHFNIERKKTAGKNIIVEVNGYDQKKLIDLAYQVKRKMSEVKEITDVVIHQGNPKPEIQIKVLHAKAGIYGLDASRIAYAVRSSLTGPIATEFLESGKEIDLRVRLNEKDRMQVSLLDEIFLPVGRNTGQKTLIALSEVSDIKLTRGMAEINRKDRHRMIKISAEIADADLLKTVSKIKSKLDSLTFPPDYNYDFGENYTEIKKSRKEMIFAFSLAVILVYMILASLFESFTYPFTIMFSVPLAIIGSLFLLYVLDKPISMPVYVGAITLAGIAVNNALVLVDYIKLLKSKGHKKWRAIIVGGQSRLRPILMMSCTTLLALLPMALDSGEGSNLWSPLALTIIGGLFSSTVLTLLILPLAVSFINDTKM